MYKKVLIIILALIILAGGGFAVWRYLLGHNGFFTDKPTTINIGAEIEGEGKSALITTSGGTIESDGNNGEKYTLTLPEKSLIETETITMRKINSLNLPHQQWSFISGVELTPDGTRLINAGELTITIPDGTNTKDLAGFSFGAHGKDFFLYPVTIQDNIATFKLSGFSGYGLVNLGGYIPKTEPSEKSKQAKQLISEIIASARSEQLLGAQNLDQAKLNKVTDILRAWYKTEVATKLSEAQSNEKMIDQAGFEYFSWLGIVQSFGLENKFSQEIEKAQDALASAIKKGAETSSEKCVSEKDPMQASFMLHLYAFAEMSGINGRQGLNAENIKELARKCAQFELKISSTFEYRCQSCDSPNIGKYSGTIPLTVDDGFNLAGEGIVNVDSYREMVGTENEHGCTPTPTFPVEIKNTKLKMAGDKPSASLIFSIKNPGDINYDCSFYIGGETLFTITGSMGSDWDFEMWRAHEDELISESEEETIFILTDWQIVNSGGVFARKVYQRTTQQSSAGTTATNKEDTILELIHKPIQ